MDSPFSASSSGGDVRLVHCVIPNCTRLIVSTDPSVKITTLGALPTIHVRTTKSQWRNAKYRYFAQCGSCERHIPDSVLATELPFTDPAGKDQKMWYIRRTALADARFYDRINDLNDENALSDEDEKFLSQEQIPCAMSGCSRRFARDDPVVDITRRGAIPPRAPATDDREGKHCVLEGCERKAEGLEWFKVGLIERAHDWNTQDKLIAGWMTKTAINWHEKEADRVFLGMGFMKTTNEDGKTVYRLNPRTDQETGEIQGTPDDRS